MALGGTPYYLDMMNRSLSIAQNIDAQFFSENAQLSKEYTFLYKSLFKESRLQENRRNPLKTDEGHDQTGTAAGDWNGGQRLFLRRARRPL